MGMATKRGCLCKNDDNLKSNVSSIDLTTTNPYGEYCFHAVLPRGDCTIHEAASAKSKTYREPFQENLPCHLLALIISTCGDTSPNAQRFTRASAEETIDECGHNSGEERREASVGR